MSPPPKGVARGKSWVEARVEVPSSLLEGVSNFLIELGFLKGRGKLDGYRVTSAVKF